METTKAVQQPFEDGIPNIFTWQNDKSELTFTTMGE